MPIVSTPSGTVVTFTRGGVKGNLPHMPGKGHLPKRLRRALVNMDDLARIGKALTREAGITSTLNKRNGLESAYAAAHHANGTRLRGKYRRP